MGAVDLLERISSPEDLRRLPREQLPELARQLRDFLLNSVARTGGHLSSNLGTVELTIALHRVFDTPHDRIVWVAGHAIDEEFRVTDPAQSVIILRLKVVGGLA